MDEKISGEFFSLLFNLCVKSTSSPHSLGESIGNRLADDFILHTGISRKLSIDELIHTVQNDFFPHYLSYSPKRRTNRLYFKNFDLLTHNKNRKDALDVFAGILNVIGACLCDDVHIKVESDDADDGSLAFYDKKNEKVKFYDLEMPDNGTRT
ncbi:hypothetical protein VCUG_00575 [Vavraia culicis subsp. floridensis]|uniref:Uncharacterized protein n=1 Tax=Vavraia culicis (isolate floridensis) TaxID=948595 RepID=L2GXB6_VAVCU|nr:uncharacterized protein VCUG_00575 [Vavraia culicis subsp. floridensis]ELA47992.1 hypothetical protein VCUG_00575 [Vavraia culicis subsp. floridensis]